MFGKPEVEDDDTEYGNDSVVWATGSGVRGGKEKVEVGQSWEEESKDEGFEESHAFRGAVERKVFKMGAKGLGYYTDRLK